jgi:hypothetical protein
MTLRLASVTKRVGAEIHLYGRPPEPGELGAVQHVDTPWHARDKSQPRKWETAQWEALQCE